MAFDPTDPDTKAALKAAVDEAVSDATAALADNNKKLVTQLREAKKGGEIDPAKHAALEDKVSDLESQLNTSTKTIKTMETTHATALSGLTKQLETESGFTQNLLVENGLSDALVKAGVEASFLPAVKAMLKGQVKIVADGDVRKALVGDKPLSDFVTGWAQGDEGKHFVKAPVNGGGGGSGGSGKGAEITTIAAGDKAAFGANLAEIAKGTNSTVKVA